MNQDKGCINYIYLFMSGHIKEFMKEWKNLNRFSNQGWKAFNSLMKSFFFCRTNKGEVKVYVRGRLLHIARLLQRKLICTAGFA